MALDSSYETRRENVDPPPPALNRPGPSQVGEHAPEARPVYSIVRPERAERDKLLIPRPSVFTANLEVFTHLETFCKLTGFRANDRQLLLRNSFPGLLRRVQGMFRSNSRPPKAKGRKNKSQSDERTPLLEDQEQDVPDTPTAAELFRSDQLKRWRKIKSELKDQIRKHWIAQSHFEEAQRHYWWTEDELRKQIKKVEKWVDIVKNCPKGNSERRDHIKSLKNAKNILQCKKRIHQRGLRGFTYYFTEESSARVKCVQLAEKLEREIVDVMAEHISRLMQDNRQEMSPERAKQYARGIYKLTSRTYEYDYVVNDPSWRGKLLPREFQESKFDKKKIKNVLSQI